MNKLTLLPAVRRTLWIPAVIDRFLRDVALREDRSVNQVAGRIFRSAFQTAKRKETAHATVQKVAGGPA